MPDAAEVIREVCNPREQQLLAMVGRGKSLGAIAKLYREYEGENGVQEALDEIRERLRRRMAPTVAAAPAPEPERTLEDALLEHTGIDAHEVAAETAAKMQNAGGAPVAAVAAPPMATPPAPRPVPSTPKLAKPGASPSTAKRGARVASQQTIEEKEAREDRAVEYVRKEGRARMVEIYRAASIPSGSASGYLERLVTAGRLAVVEEDGVTYYEIPGSAPKPAAKPAAPKSPSPAAKAPDAGSAGSAQNASEAPADAPLSNGNGVVDGLLVHLLVEGRDWTAEKTHKFVGHVRELSETLHAD